MWETLAVVTFLLTDGGTATARVYPPGGEYHRHFGHICQKNKPLAADLVRKMYEEKKLTPPEHTEKILKIDVSCTPSTRA